MSNDLVFGLHAVEALLKRAPQDVLEIFALKDRDDKRMQPLLQQLQLLVEGAANTIPVGLPTQPAQRWRGRKDAAVKGAPANRRYRRKATGAAASKAKRN